MIGIHQDEDNMNTNFIFNLRIWKFHIQIYRGVRVVPMFAWFDFWVGFFFDQKAVTTYIFPIPMIGFRVEGFGISTNKHYNFKEEPFIYLFHIGRKNRWIRKGNYYEKKLKETIYNTENGVKRFFIKFKKGDTKFS